MPRKRAYRKLTRFPGGYKVAVRELPYRFQEGNLLVRAVVYSLRRSFTEGFAHEFAT